MKTVFAVVAALALPCLGIVAQADVFNMGPGLVSIETVRVSDVENDGEWSGESYGGRGPDAYCGAVYYKYRISKYEITAAQYADFLNHKAKSDPYALYNEKMSTNDYGCKIVRGGIDGDYNYTVVAGFENLPANFVSFWDTLRFANWLHNGQGDGDTETGAYTLDGYTGGEGDWIQRNPGAKWFLTSEDEWYKAAYYKGGGIHAGYWDYPMQSDMPTVPSNDVIDPDPGNNANFEVGGVDYSVGAPYWRTQPGEFENSGSAHGTFDQGGNVWEWNEAIVVAGYRSIRGGAYIAADETKLHAAERGHFFEPWREWRTLGFRVAAPPEPPVGINNRAAYDSIISAAAARYDFKVWGEVTILDYSSFTLNDGSGMPVKVLAPGYVGIQDGDYACASGEFSGEGVDRVLNAQSSTVVKLQ